jgi:deoxycytidine triphosphate deaminase
LLLSKPDILAYLRSGKLRFDPQVSEDRVAQVSVDLRLGRKFATFKKPGYLRMNPRNSCCSGCPLLSPKLTFMA